MPFELRCVQRGEGLETGSPGFFILRSKESKSDINIRFPRPAKQVGPSAGDGSDERMLFHCASQRGL